MATIRLECGAGLNSGLRGKAEESGHRLLAIVVALSFACAGVLAQVPVIPQNVVSNVRQRVDYGYCPGIVVGLMNTNGAAYFSYGHTDLEGGPAVDENTLFEIGSITKVFTATLLADMAERGEVGLTDPIEAYLPAEVVAPRWQGRSITLTQLSTHTSGLPGAPDNLAPTQGDNPFAGYTSSRMYEFLNSYTLTRGPGTYEYSNYAVGLLGQLLARRVGVDYGALVMTRIADELGLVDTRIDPTPAQQARVARGYSGVVPIPPFEMDALEAAGDLRSTARDLLTFLAANRGWVDTRLQPAMVEAQKSRASAGSPGLSIGLGWHLYALGAGTAVWHNGATIGQRAFAGFLRNGRTLAVVLANSDFDVTDLGFHLLDSTVPLTSVRRPANVNESVLRHYVGRYERSGEDHFTVELLSGHLIVRYSRDMGRGLTLHPSGISRFYLTFPEASTSFTTNAMGQATALAWTQSGATTTYPKIRLAPSLALRRVDGLAQIVLSGDTDRNYVIQASTDMERWSNIATNTIWDGAIPDAASAGLDRRFYRVLEP